jgi:hypothetical protein
VSVGQDIDTFRPNLVNDPVVALKNLADRLILVFGHYPAAVGLVFDTIAPVNQATHKTNRIDWLVLGYAFKNLSKAVFRSARPCDLHWGYSPSCRRNSLLSVT